MSNRTTYHRTDNVVKSLSGVLRRLYSIQHSKEESLEKTLLYFENLLSRCAYENKELHDMLAARLIYLKEKER